PAARCNGMGRLLRFGLVLLAAGLAAAGARADDKPWAFRAPVRPAVPAVKDRARVRSPVDAFLLARLQPAGLTFAPEADRRTLVRRVTFDLTGLPPAPEALEAALSDTPPDWYEKLVDRLLSSPGYGERWATFWLDLARYAESDGFKADDV